MLTRALWIVSATTIMWGVLAQAAEPTLDAAVATYLRGAFSESLAQFAALAARNEPEAGYWIGAIHAKGAGVPRNFPSAAEWYRKAANQGVAAAQFRLGLLLESGTGVSANPVEAVKLYQAAAKQGHLLAMRALGMAYEGGKGVGRDLAAALSWYHRAAFGGDDGSFASARRVAAELREDNGLKPLDAAFVVFELGNRVRALGDLLDASQAGDSEAMAWLGDFYENGYAGPKDFANGVKYYAAAAAGGSLKGKTDYATALLHGVGTKPDRAKALTLLREAADAGFALAQFNLALLLERGGDAEAPDPAAARRWYRAAGLLGYEPAWDELKRLAKDEGAAPPPD